MHRVPSAVLGRCCDPDVGRDRSGHANPSQALRLQAPGPERAVWGPGRGSLPHGEAGCEPALARRTDTGRRRRRGGPAMELFTQGLSLGHYLALGAVPFCLSVAGIFPHRKNVLILLLSIDLMLPAVNGNFRPLPPAIGRATVMG